VRVGTETEAAATETVAALFVGAEADAGCGLRFYGPYTCAFRVAGSAVKSNAGEAGEASENQENQVEIQVQVCSRCIGYFRVHKNELLP
jgi:hypothetical protein